MAPIVTHSRSRSHFINCNRALRNRKTFDDFELLKCATSNNRNKINSMNQQSGRRTVGVQL